MSWLPSALSRTQRARPTTSWLGTRQWARVLDYYPHGRFRAMGGRNLSEGVRRAEAGASHR